jgi:hypothetical protein
MGRPRLARALAPGGRPDAARARRCTRSLAPLGRRVFGADRFPRRATRATGRRAEAVRQGRPARGAARHDPPHRRTARLDDRGRGRRDQPLRQPGEARLLRSTRPARPPVGQARPRSGPLSKSGSRLLGWAAVEAAQQAWRESNPCHGLYVDVSARSGNRNSAKAAVARKILIAVWSSWSGARSSRATSRGLMCVSGRRRRRVRGRVAR